MGKIISSYLCSPLKLLSTETISEKCSSCCCCSLVVVFQFSLVGCGWGTSYNCSLQASTDVAHTENALSDEGSGKCFLDDSLDLNRDVEFDIAVQGSIW
jgi:hypothetical protein